MKTRTMSSAPVTAPSSITNPKTVLHLDLILKGLKQSLEMVGRSGQMLAEMVPQLAGF